MLLLAIGLVLFLAVHLVPAAPFARRALVARWGEARYKTLFSIVAGAGLAAIVVGYAIAARGAQLFDPWPAAVGAAPWIVTLAFVLFAASHMRGHLRHGLQHPMVIGVVLWAAVHLLANGDQRGTLLFGGFLAWAIVDLFASLRRGPIVPFVPAWRYDAMAIVGGTAVSLLVMALHRVLFGVAPVSFGI